MCVWVWVCVAVKWGCGEAYETGVCLGVGVCGGEVGVWGGLRDGCVSGCGCVWRGGQCALLALLPPLHTHTLLPPPHTHTTLTRTAFGELFAALDRCEALLGGQRYLAGARLTEADIRLFVTLIRFDPVYGAEGGGGGKEG